MRLGWKQIDAISQKPITHAFAYSPTGSDQDSEIIVVDITFPPSKQIVWRITRYVLKRPAGSVSPDHGVTGPATFPILPVAYTAPEASGITDLQVTCSPQGGIPATAIFTIGLEIDGLEPALNAPSLIIFTSEIMHGNNNGYATPETSGALIEMSISYVDQLTQLGVAVNNIPPLRIKALSLPQGGLFDYQTEWNTPHKLHRNGTDADVGLANLPTRKLKQADEAAFRQAGFRAPIQHERPGDADSNHWHLKARGGA